MQLAMPSPGPGVKRIMFACVAVFLAQFLLSIPQPGAANEITRWFGISPTKWTAWFPLVPVWQLLSWGFLHDLGDPMHILMNLMFLYFLGTMLEEIIGTRRFVVNYLGALLVSGMVTVLVGVLTDQTAPTIGASGAVLFVVVAMATLRPDTRMIFILFPITLKTLALMYVGLDIFMSLQGLKGVDSNVAHAAHLSGAAWGFFLVRKGWIWRDPLQQLEAHRAQRQDQRKESDGERLDALLTKIKREGIHALSLSEKAFLKRMSKNR